MKGYELKTSHQISSGEVVSIVIDENTPSIIIFTEDGTKIGNIDLSEVDNGYRITWMYLDQLDASYTKKGIGRACLQFFRETYSMPIFAAENDGHKRDDGSHLTGDAHGFIQRMRDEGIVS